MAARIFSAIVLFTARLESSGASRKTARGEPDQADVTIATDAATLAALLHGERTLADALRAGDLALDGREDLAERFVGLFPLPEPVSLSS
ncbi:alkyl sulfatase C-terminal domain-containing protein [Sphaerisporangium sp. NPDC004334]